jgi:hypothetical protein
MKINYIVETKSWVQFKRINYLRSCQNKYSFRAFTIKQFYWLWMFGMLRQQPVVFSSWGMVAP